MDNYYSHFQEVNCNIPTIAVSIEIIDTINKENLEMFIEQEVKVCLSKYSMVEVKDIDIIEGFNELHRQYGKKSKKIKSAPENLIKIMKKRKTIPRISSLVDIYNLISIKYALALGAHDLDKVQGNVVLKRTEGGEIFYPIGSNESEEIFPDEYGYFDSETNEVLCRLETRQSNTSKLTESSKKVLLIIQGNKRTTKEYLLSAKEELLKNIKLFFKFEIKDEYDFTGEK